MMLASNIPIKSKENLIKITRCYLNRWRIEEYFKFKKQEYNFENFRVRSLNSIYKITIIYQLFYFIKNFITKNRNLKLNTSV